MAQLDALDPVVRDKLSGVSTATLTTRLLDEGMRQQFLVGVGPINPNVVRFVGEAFTMRFIPAREDVDTLASLRSADNLQWQAMETVAPGQVIIVDSRSDPRAASAGDMLVMRAMRRGAAAFVTDGAVRDARAITELKFPTFAREVTATSRLSLFHVADLQVPIGCAGVAVYPGDIVVGDSDGVVVIPRNLASKIADAAVDQEDLEEYLHGLVREGSPLWGVYPPDETTMANFREWRRSRDAAEAKVVRSGLETARERQ